MAKTQKHFAGALIALLFVLFMDGVGQGLIFPILTKGLVTPGSTLLVTHASQGIRDLLYGITVGVFFLTWFFGGPLLSDYSDSVGRKKILTVCLLGTVVGFILTALAFIFHLVWLVILGRLIDGFTAGSQATAQAAIIDSVPQENQAKYIGFILFAVSIGFIAGPLIGGVFSDNHLVKWFSETTPLYLATILGLLNIVILLMFYKDAREITHKTKLKLSRAVTVFASAFKDKAVRILSIAFVLLHTTWCMFFLFGPVFITQKFAMSGLQIGIFMGLMGIGLAIGLIGIVPWCEKHGSSAKKVVLIGYGIVVIANLIAIFTNSMWFFWIDAIPTSAALGTAYPFLMKLFSQQVDADRQGWVMGITTGLMAFDAGFSVLISGILAGVLVTLPFIVSSVIGILGLLVLMPAHLKAGGSGEEGEQLAASEI